ncbi:hypothetical protein DSO57_1028133 [Entomophthora muscae]|uniref:Uncharacterized protein n=1 Tax=Entomophthora muscae TaxID=34485 RepID=A0ACC2RSK6_9FUNG|nr:hypothetical protein DSO57_1028133 [Entomophthora muscae]
MLHQSSNNLLHVLHCCYPIVGAPMANVSGGRLAASTTAAGGFGFIGAGYGTADELQGEIDHAELDLERSHVHRIPSEDGSGLLAIGIGFITWNLRNKQEVLECAIQARPLAFWFSFGDYRPYVSQVRKKIPNAVIFVQVDNLADALATASDKDVDILVLQGLEAGGHGPKNGSTTFCIIPEVAEALSSKGPLLLAAGGVSGWRQLAGALSLGAHGVVLGTRLSVAAESLLHPEAKEMIIQAEEGSRSTITTPQIDRLRGEAWDLDRYTARALKNKIFNENPTKISSEEYRNASAQLNFEFKAVFAGLGVGTITAVEPTKEIISGIVTGYYYNHVQTRQRTEWIPRVRL